MSFAQAKTGQGAYSVRVENDGRTFVRLGDAGETKEREFPTARAAYDNYRARSADGLNHAAWNVCYALEDVLVPD